MSDIKNRAPTRIAAIDAYRGAVMFLMMAEVLHLSRVAEAIPGSSFWQFLANHQTHVEWAGCTLHDLIQPSFSFLVGVALPFSIASRLARGQSIGLMIVHASWRALVLVLLGVFLRSVGKEQTYWTFEDTLSQIGLGYVPLFLLGLTVVRPASSSLTDGAAQWDPAVAETQRADRAQSGSFTLLWCWLALAVVLIGYWGAFAVYPAPGADFDYEAVGVPAGWPNLYSGFAAHWNKNSNLAWAFDTWFLNLFPRAKAFTHNGGGYATLSFIPTLGTMILGLIAGEWLRRTTMVRQPSHANGTGTNDTALSGTESRMIATPWATVAYLTVAGVACLVAGFTLDWFGICPSVKRIWTPAWTLFSGGWCFLLLAGFYVASDAIGFRAWSYPLRVIGANSIAAYCIAHLWGGFIVNSFKTHLGANFFAYFGSAYEPLLRGAAVLTAYWLILFWMDRRRIYLRI